MTENENVKYRLSLAEGFLREAEEDFKIKRWRSCVSNSQISLENSGKAILSLFGPSVKTHDPAVKIAEIVKRENLPQNIKNKIEEVLPDLISLGSEEHFLTDYGDEGNYLLPWDIFTKESADEAFHAAKNCFERCKELIEEIRRWRDEN